MLIKPLFITSSFLRKKSPVSIVERAFVKGLSVSGNYNIKIACSDYKRIKWECYEHLIIVPENKVLRYFCAILERLGFNDLINRPDPIWFTWGMKAIRRLSKKDNASRYDYIHSFSLSCSNHLVALKLKEKYGKPFVAHFLDPWYGNPYRPIKSKRLRNKDLEMERDIASNADLIIHDNELIADLWRERYGDLVKDKIHVLPLVFNIPDEKYNIQTNKDKLIISHIGNFNNSRRISEFADALYYLLENNPATKNKIKVYLVGDIPNGQIEYIRKLGLSSIVHFEGSVSEEDCTKYYLMSDVFIAIDSINELPLFFPSKLMKYFYYKKPIIGITPSGSVMEIELKRSRNFSYRHDEIELIAGQLSKLIYNYQEESDKIDKGYWKKFSPDSVAEEYTQIINSLLSSKK